MASEVFVVGLSWRTAPVSVREKLAFRDDEIDGALAQLCRGAVSEAMIVSTCNRVEIYGCTSKTAAASMVDVATAEARSFLARSRGVSGESMASHLYEHADVPAVQHIFRVASALDSLVLGESQILGQLKSAFGLASGAGATGPVIGRCMERAFGVAKRVRTETDISRGAANVSSVAVELAKSVFGDLLGKNVLVVGAGKMSVLAARHLRTAGASSIVVVNRSLERAQQLATEIDGTARPWDTLVEQLTAADVVISSTASAEPVLTKPVVKSAMKKRRYRPQIIVDIAVPRDADPVISKLEGVYLFDVDDLQKVVDENLKGRSRAADDAQIIVDEEVGAFSNWVRQQRVVPTIRALRKHFHDVAMLEAEKTAMAIERASTPAERSQAVRRLGELIVNKLLHPPMSALKDESTGDVQALIDAANRLFALAGEEEGDEAGETAANKADTATPRTQKGPT